MPRLLLIFLFLATQPVLGAQLEIPLRVPLKGVQEALKSALGPSLYRAGPCRYLDLGEPRLEAAQGALRLSGPGNGTLGVEIGGTCRRAVAWRGAVDFTLVPRIDEAGRLRMKILDSGLSHASTGINMLWDLGKRQAHARLEHVSYDLGASREALRGLLRSAVPPNQVAAMESVLDDMRVLAPRVEGNEIVVPVALELPAVWIAAPDAVSAAPLTEAEMDALDEALQPWDAFLVYIVRQAAADGQDAMLRQRLFTLLLDS